MAVQQKGTMYLFEWKRPESVQLPGASQGEGPRTETQVR